MGRNQVNDKKGVQFWAPFFAKGESEKPAISMSFNMLTLQLFFVFGKRPAHYGFSSQPDNRET